VDRCRFKIANCAPAPAPKPTAEFGHLHHRRLLLLLAAHICTRAITTTTNSSSSSCTPDCTRPSEIHQTGSNTTAALPLKPSAASSPPPPPPPLAAANALCYAIAAPTSILHTNSIRQTRRILSPDPSWLLPCAQQKGLRPAAFHCCLPPRPSAFHHHGSLLLLPRRR
jgi:hypothetical protein